jgi:HTH-type transcriptional regulator, competence development regulator
MSGGKETFGAVVRQERERLKIGLREMARQIGVSATYVSMIERDEFPPPAEDKISGIAKIIGRDRDELLALAGKISSDLETKIVARPREMAGLVRNLSEFSRADLVILDSCVLHVLAMKKVPRSPEAAAKQAQEYLAALLKTGNKKPPSERKSKTKANPPPV